MYFSQMLAPFWNFFIFLYVLLFFSPRISNGAKFFIHCIYHVRLKQNKKAQQRQEETLPTVVNNILNPHRMRHMN